MQIKELTGKQNRHICERTCKTERWAVISYLYFINCHWNKEHSLLKLYFADLFEKLVKNFKLYDKIVSNLELSLSSKGEARSFTDEELLDMLEFSNNRIQSILQKMYSMSEPVSTSSVKSIGETTWRFHTR